MSETCTTQCVSILLNLSLTKVIWILRNTNDQIESIDMIEQHVTIVLFIYLMIFLNTYVNIIFNEFLFLIISIWMLNHLLISTISNHDFCVWLTLSSFWNLLYFIFWNSLYYSLFWNVFGFQVFDQYCDCRAHRDGSTKYWLLFTKIPNDFILFRYTCVSVLVCAVWVYTDTADNKF